MIRAEFFMLNEELEKNKENKKEETEIEEEKEPNAEE